MTDEPTLIVSNGDDPAEFLGYSNNTQRPDLNQVYGKYTPVLKSFFDRASIQEPRDTMSLSNDAVDLLLEGARIADPSEIQAIKQALQSAGILQD